MDELNLRAERAAPCPFCGGELNQHGDFYIHPSGPCFFSEWEFDALNVEKWNRRAAPVAQLDADLPPLPAEPYAAMMRLGGGYLDVFTAEQYRQGQREVAMQYVERIRHLERELAGAQAELKAVETRMAASSDGGAQPAQSIEEDNKFQCFLYNYVAARMKLADGSGTKDEATDAFRALIAYIDGRTAGTASEAAPDPVVEANRQLLLDRSRVGVKKYGVTLGAAGLAGHHLMQHALEEALDLANYLQTLMQTERAHTMPDGWKPVPQQYTDAQLAAGVAQYEAVAGGAVSAESICGVIYDGMIAAAPSTQEGAND